MISEFPISWLCRLLPPCGLDGFPSHGYNHVTKAYVTSSEVLSESKPNEAPIVPCGRRNQNFVALSSTGRHWARWPGINACHAKGRADAMSHSFCVCALLNAGSGNFSTTTGPWGHDSVYVCASGGISCNRGEKPMPKLFCENFLAEVETMEQIISNTSHYKCNLKYSKMWRPQLSGPH